MMNEQEAQAMREMGEKLSGLSRELVTLRYSIDQINEQVWKTYKDLHHQFTMYSHLESIMLLPKSLPAESAAKLLSVMVDIERSPIPEGREPR